MRKLVAAAICLMPLSLSVITGRKCIKEARTRTGKKCCEQQLRRIDKALSRAGDIPEGSWICLSYRNLILAEDKRCSCLSSWGHGKTLLKRPISERLYAVFDEVGRNSVNTSLGQTGATNGVSSQIKNSRPTPCSLPRSKNKKIKKVTSVFRRTNDHALRQQGENCIITI